MTLEEKSFKVLELQAVLKLLADEAVSDGATVSYTHLTLPTNSLV